MKYLNAGILLLAITATAAADDRQIADSWLEAYQAQDFDTMGSFLNENSRFIDPTSFGREGFDGPIDWTGPEAILSGIRAWGVTHAEYHFEDVFESPGRVIYRGSIDVTYGMPDARYSFNFPITTIISVDSGHVAEHRDYTDYDGATALTDE